MESADPVRTDPSTSPHHHLTRPGNQHPRTSYHIHDQRAMLVRKKILAHTGDPKLLGKSGRLEQAKTSRPQQNIVGLGYKVESSEHVHPWGSSRLDRRSVPAQKTGQRHTKTLLYYLRILYFMFLGTASNHNAD